MAEPESVLIEWKKIAPDVPIVAVIDPLVAEANPDAVGNVIPNVAVAAISVADHIATHEFDTVVVAVMTTFAVVADANST